MRAAGSGTLVPVAARTQTAVVLGSAWRACGATRPRRAAARGLRGGDRAGWPGREGGDGEVEGRGGGDGGRGGGGDAVSDRPASKNVHSSF